MEQRGAAQEKFVHLGDSRQGEARGDPATSSFAGTYLVVLDLEEAQLVCDYILGNGNREDFLKRFAGATSPGLIPTGIWCALVLPTRPRC